jgi:hypothetical protein
MWDALTAGDEVVRKYTGDQNEILELEGLLAEEGADADEPPPPPPYRVDENEALGDEVRRSIRASLSVAWPPATDAPEAYGASARRSGPGRLGAVKQPQCFPI